MEEKKAKKKKIRLGGLLVIILFLYLLFSFGYYLYTLPIKEIDINNNYYLSDDYIIDLLNINNKTIFKLGTRKCEKILNKEDLINNADVKKDIFGKVTINVNEEKILFYNWNNKKVILKDDEINNNSMYLGVPSLINYVPKKIYSKLVTKMNLIDRNIINMISEIEYDPDIVGTVTIDENRFLLRMNDGNKIYVNIYNIKKLNNYLEIYDALLKNNSLKNGCLFLDSNSKNYVYSNCVEEVVTPPAEGE